MENYGCLDCSKPYQEFGLDTVLSHEQWKLIHPEEIGVLCSQCIVNRAEKLGAVIIKSTIEFKK